MATLVFRFDSRLYISQRDLLSIYQIVLVKMYMIYVLALNSEEMSCRYTPVLAYGTIPNTASSLASHLKP